MARQLTPTARRIKAARDLAGLQKLAAIIFVRSFIRALSGLEKLDEGLIGDEFRLGIDCAAKGFKRDAAP